MNIQCHLIIQWIKQSLNIQCFRDFCILYVIGYSLRDIFLEGSTFTAFSVMARKGRDSPLARAFEQDNLTMTLFMDSRTVFCGKQIILLPLVVLIHVLLKYNIIKHKSLFDDDGYERLNHICHFLVFNV